MSDLGRRLRRAREARGLSVSELARRSGLSRRWLTEAESGRANPSVLVLARLAQALELPLGELVESPARARRSERVALVGLRGAGKSSLGPRLALALEVPFVELDRRVEELAGMSLAEIFAVHGETGFHRLECEALEALLGEGERMVIATSGSIVDSERNFARLCATCRTVWLRASPEDHYQRVVAQGDLRPMRDRPRAREELRRILDARAPLYGRCELSVETSGRSLEAVLEELCRRLVPADASAEQSRPGPRRGPSRDHGTGVA